ncbi:YaiO family outer membrane beta-barrel protein [Polaromonas sp.]|uniref:YaiO family outer membrane beta-barrel protein n=1 Tax=Polaromonas sp. TaxID=1869339 RepID=UPI00286AD61F|nr:YaiO family outer membrane beta-barrel protein [Polaromonas sp.]
MAGFFSTLAIAMPVLATDTNTDSEPAIAQTQLELGAESSRLSNGSPDWRELSARITRKLGPRDVRELTLTQTRRFGLDDQQLSGLYSTPLSDKLTATLGANISPSHRVLAKLGVEGTLQYEFAPAWLLHAGVGDKRYDTVHVQQASLMLEHYFSSFSVTAAWRPVRALGVNASSAELRGSYYYGDANFAGVIVSSGQEATSVNANTVLLADVRAVAFLGRHWLSRQWAVNYAITSTRQGSFYNRNSVRLGAQYLF